MRDKKLVLTAAVLVAGLSVNLFAAKDPLVAKVNGSKIKKSELEYRIDQLDPQSQEFFKEKGNKERLLDNLIDQEVLYIQAKKNKYQKSKAFKNKIKLLEKELLVQELIKLEVDEKITISDEDLQAYYKANDSRFKSKPEFNISHIVVKTKDEADSLLRKLKSGASWNKTASKYSIDTSSKDNGGKLGWIARDEGSRIDIAFGDELATLTKNNQLSGVVATKFGYHIIKRHAKKMRERVSFDSVKSRLKDELKSVKSRELYEKLLEDAKAKLKIVRKIENL